MPEKQDSQPQLQAEAVVKPDGMQQFFEWAKSVALDIHQGHVVFGHEKLASVAVVGFKKLVGLVKLDKPRCALDKYRFVLDMNWTDAAMSFKKTAMYKDIPQHHLKRTPYDEPYKKN